SHDKSVKVWDAQTGKEVLSLKGHTDVVEAVAFSPDGQHLASGSRDQTIKIWNVQNGQEEVRTLRGHTDEVVGLAFGRDDQLASGSHDRSVKIWDPQRDQDVRTMKHTLGVLCVAFSPDGQRLASGGGEPNQGEVRVRDAQSGQEILTLQGGH